MILYLYINIYIYIMGTFKCIRTILISFHTDAGLKISSNYTIGLLKPILHSFVFQIFLQGLPNDVDREYSMFLAEREKGMKGSDFIVAIQRAYSVTSTIFCLISWVGMVVDVVCILQGSMNSCNIMEPKKIKQGEPQNPKDKADI